MVENVLASGDAESNLQLPAGALGADGGDRRALRGSGDDAVPAQSLGNLAAECLALCTGIFPKRPPSTSEVKQALSLLRKADHAFRAFLEADKTEPYEYEPPPEQEQLLSDLSVPAGSDTWVQEELPITTVPAWLIKVNEARAYCFAKWPKYDAKTVTPSYFDLAEDELGDIWEIVRAVDSADTLLAEMRSHTLSPAQVAAVAENFPAYYAALIEIFDEALTDFVAKSQKKDGKPLSIPQEDVIRTFKQLGEDDPIGKPEQPGAPAATSAQKAKDRTNNVAVNTPISSAIEARQQGAAK
jgi:hypothetical protein